MFYFYKTVRYECRTVDIACCKFFFFPYIDEADVPVFILNYPVSILYRNFSNIIYISSRTRSVKTSLNLLNLMAKYKMTYEFFGTMHAKAAE